MEIIFEYSEDFEAKNINAAEDKFIDTAWGDKLVKFIEKETGKPLKKGGHDVIEVLEETNDRDYIKSVDKLANGMTMTIQIWENDEDAKEPFYGLMTIAR
ncbi:hypothetical protein [Enterococcus sp. AZ163]|uniref:hypothetical protein n=1 Tax=Enterococcus sp. AZ163 TaxID=2774638 RepID=UPI003D2D66B4